MILVQGKHKAIIDEEIFDKTHEKLAAKSFKPGRPIGGDFWLRGLIKCPECGNNMVCDDHITTQRNQMREQLNVITFVHYSTVQEARLVIVIRLGRSG